MKKRMMISTATLLAILACGAANALADNQHNTNTTTTTVTGITGTITQVNLGTEGTINGFLLGTNVLLEFSHSVCGGIGSLGIVGNVVTYSGRATTNTATGFQSVSVTSFTNGAKTYTSASTEPAPVAFGPTAGTVGAFNYSDGGINGFHFGSVLVVTGTPSTTLAPLLLAGAAVTVTGTSETEADALACTTVVPVTVVNATSLTFGTTVITINGHNH
jgi:hypothetical protein